jgi:uncharacterized protein (DUF488 family)
VSPSQPTRKADIPTIHTIGHSTRTREELIEILHHYGITSLVDVRTMPRSRHTPQFNEDDMQDALPAAGIAYQHLAKLGGLRHAKKDSINTGWRNASFRGYADYMQTPEFKEGLDELIEIAQASGTAIMCAEAVPWRCHRSMIGDALLIRGWVVIDIFDNRKAEPEKLTDFAHVEDFTITYPGESTSRRVAD